MSGSSPASAPHAIPSASAQAGGCIQPAALAAPNPAAVNSAPPARCVWLITPFSPLTQTDRERDRTRGRLAHMDLSAAVAQPPAAFAVSVLAGLEFDPAAV